MRKTITLIAKAFTGILVFLLFSAKGYCQDPPTFTGSLSDFYSAGQDEAVGHLKFEGVEITGSLQSVMMNLRKTLKFKPSGKSEWEPFMKGEFGKDKVDIRLGTVPNHDIVYVLVVSYPGFRTYSAMTNKYESTKLKLMSRFGDPIDIDEIDPKNSITVYGCPEGNITLATSEDGFVRIYYVDRKNAEIAQHEKYE